MQAAVVNPDFNLVLVHTPPGQWIGDFIEIANRIAVKAPDIKVFIASNLEPDPAMQHQISGRPTLIFSPIQLHEFKSRNGKVFCGQSISKIDQMVRLAKAGVPVPKSAILTPDLNLDPASWGEFVLLKPDGGAGSSSHGQGLQVKRTSRTAYRAPSDYPEDHPGHKWPMLVQSFIDSGPYQSNFRVLTLFGEPLYALFNSATDQRPAFDQPDDVIEAGNFANNAGDRTRKYIEDADVLELARRIYQAVPEAPLQASDIVRDINTGEMFVLEINPGGNTWHFSSTEGYATQAEAGGREQLIAQFGAWDVAARVLIDVTRAQAE